MGFTARVEHHPTVPPDGASLTVVAAAGDIDIETAPALHAAFTEALGYGGCTIVVDLAEVGFLDSSGIGALVWLLHAPGRPAVVVANARPIVRNALRVMGLDEVLHVHAFGTPPPLPGVLDTSG